MHFYTLSVVFTLFCHISIILCLYVDAGCCHLDASWWFSEHEEWGRARGASVCNLPQCSRWLCDGWHCRLKQSKFSTFASLFMALLHSLDKSVLSPKRLQRFHYIYYRQVSILITPLDHISTVTVSIAGSPTSGPGSRSGPGSISIL